MVSSIESTEKIVKLFNCITISTRARSEKEGKRKMKKKSSSIIIGILYLSTFLMIPLQVRAQEIVWKTNPTPLPVATYSHSSVIHNGKVYLIGGRRSEEPDASKNWMDSIFFAGINPDGTIDSWIKTTSLPEGRTSATAVVWNDFVYVIGGGGPVPPSVAQQRNTVWRAPIYSDGSIGSWVTTTSLPYASCGHWTVVWNGRIYVGGGTDGYGWKNTVVYAEINSDGSPGNWISTTSLPLAYGMVAEVVYNGRIYLIGGTSTWGGQGLSHKEVYYASINADGSVGSWVLTTSIPEGRAYADAILIDNNIYVIGGIIDEENTVQDSVYKAAVNTDGTVGSWIELQKIPEPRDGHSALAFQGRIYVIGGEDKVSGEAIIKDTAYYTISTIPIPPDNEAILRPLIAVATAIFLSAICLTTIALHKKKNRKQTIHSPTFFIYSNQTKLAY